MEGLGEYCDGDGCAAGLICWDDNSVCVPAGGLGSDCAVVIGYSDIDYPIFCEKGLTCSADGKCARSTLTPCSNQDDCTTNTINTLCHKGACRRRAVKYAACAPYPLFPEAQQAWCTSPQVCLHKFDNDQNYLGDACYDDMCYGLCGDGTVCDPETLTCQSTSPESTCTGVYLSPCCNPWKDVKKSECDVSVQKCVCAFDPSCCEILDTNQERRPGWDMQCVKEATEVCFVTCEKGTKTTAYPGDTNARVESQKRALEARAKAETLSAAAEAAAAAADEANQAAKEAVEAAEAAEAAAQAI